MRGWWLRQSLLQQAGYVWAATVLALALLATGGWALIYLAIGGPWR